MSDNASAVSAVEETPPVTPESSTPKLSHELIAEMREKGDAEGLNAVIQATMNPQAPDSQEAPPAGDNPPQTEVHDAPVSEKSSDENSGNNGKIFSINYQGQKVDIPDDDTYLGYGSFGKLKKTHAHQKKTLEGYEEKVRNARTQADQANMEKTALQQKYDEALEKLNTSPQIVPPNIGDPQPAKVEPPKPEEKIDMPAVPVYPSLPKDVNDWLAEDSAKFNEYQNARSVYDEKMTSIVQNLSTRQNTQNQPTVQYNNDPALEKNVNEMKEYFETVKATNQREANEKNKKNFWSSLGEFQNLHSEELATANDLQSIHNSVQNWMDGLAWANGVSLPENASGFQHQEYAKQKKVVVDRFLKDDPTVVANAAGTPAPAGYAQYFKIAEVQEKKNGLIKQGILGQNASLQDAWKHLYSDNEISADINALEANARAEGSQAVLQNLQQNQKNNAINLPNSVAQNAQENSGPVNIDKAEAVRLLKMTPQELQAADQFTRDKVNFILANTKPS